ncbi:hypothetical protein EWM64_g9736 [Hericium alpestre]|uniref:MADS-box domain-containing protein n=1 Tax=Hericium alpestre TaxID=135208 RepID=A0A4Y9ZHQ6_9AGAM|nr:hypothetical protein EWM64_g9736 [Hericium alpestre]
MAQRPQQYPPLDVQPQYPSYSTTVPPLPASTNDEASAKRQRLDMPSDPQAPPADQFIADQDAADSAAEDDDDSDKPKSDKKAGRRKIKIEFIQDKSRRHITFSKRKAGMCPVVFASVAVLTVV